MNPCSDSMPNSMPASGAHQQMLAGLHEPAIEKRYVVFQIILVHHFIESLSAFTVMRPLLQNTLRCLSHVKQIPSSARRSFDVAP